MHVHCENLNDQNENKQKKKINFFFLFLFRTHHRWPTETRYHIETPESRTFGSGRARENRQGWPRNEVVSE